MPCNDELFALKIVTWSYNCFLRVLSFLKPYNCANYLYYYIGILDMKLGKKETEKTIQEM